MQRIRLNRALLTELDRCDKSFVMSLFWHGLDNDSLQQKGGVSADTSDVYNARRELLYNTSSLARSIGEAGGITTIDCTTSDIQEKLDLTWQAIESGEQVVIADGALDGDNYIVPFSVLHIRRDGLWEVYHQSTKSYDMSNATNRHKALTSMHRDAAPLMYVLANYYPKQVARFAVIAANKRYLTPYPTTDGDMAVNPDEALYCVDLDIFTDNLANYIGCDNPMDKVYELQQQLSANPFWIPECEMGTQCKSPYVCPYYEYCYREKQSNMPNSVFFYLPSTDAKKLEKNGYLTMDDVLELSYSYPALTDIPCADNPDKTFEVSEIALREVRSYEMGLLGVQRAVQEFLN